MRRLSPAYLRRLDLSGIGIVIILMLLWAGAMPPVLFMALLLALVLIALVPLERTPGKGEVGHSESAHIFDRKGKERWEDVDRVLRR